MLSPIEAILAAAMELPENDRLVLIARLLETLPKDDSAIAQDDDTFVQELDRRFADRRGCATWPELRAES